MFKIILFIVAGALLSLAVVAGARYPGSWGVYLGFTFVANALLLNGFRKRAIYFDTFIGLFLWLGFWLKLSVRVVLSSGQFREPTGSFDGSGSAFDEALIVSSCGLAAFVVASFVRERWFSYPDEPTPCSRSGLFHVYSAYRLQIVAVFIAGVIAIAGSNVWLGVYQRGMVSQTILPFGLNGAYKWLLQFGFASISALIIRFELELNRGVSMMAVVPPLLESFLSNVSLLSRGMILNTFALAVGGGRWFVAKKVHIGLRQISIVGMSIGVFFLMSVLVVNYLRAFSFDDPQVSVQSAAAASVGTTTPLFIDRWVGIEGILAVSSSDQLGWQIWREAWREKFDERQHSLYDRTFVSEHYASALINTSRNHFINLPGLIAFLYYPGSLLFLFGAGLLVAWLAAGLEVLTYHLCDRNWILCSLFAQVVAFRFASFGYVPAQSYLLFGTLLLNLILLAVADRLLRWHFHRHDTGAIQP